MNKKYCQQQTCKFLRVKVLAALLSGLFLGNSTASAAVLDWSGRLTYGNSDTSGTIPWNPVFNLTNIDGTGIDATVRFDPRIPRDVDTTTTEAEFDWIQPYFGTKNVLRYWPTGAPGPNSTHIAFSENIKLSRTAIFGRLDSISTRYGSILEAYPAANPDGTCAGAPLTPTLTMPVQTTDDYQNHTNPALYPVPLSNTITSIDSNDVGEQDAAFDTYSMAVPAGHPFNLTTFEATGAFALGTGQNGNKRSPAILAFDNLVTRCLTWHIFGYESDVALGEGDIDNIQTSGYLGPVIFETIPHDFGDAPAPYKTSTADNGASHTVVSGVALGNMVDTEVDGQPSVGADGDGTDEDGVVFYNTAVPGEKLYFSALSETMGHRINAWIDWNGDGTWDNSEQILNDRFGLNFPDISSIDVPLTAVAGTTYARFRICNTTNNCNTPEGAVDNGEVEDYRLTIEEAATIGDFVWLDDNNNGVQDIDETGIQHVVVQLFEADGTLVEQTLTDIDGAYHFTTQAGADYYLEFLNPSPNGYAFTQQGAGIATTDSDADPATGRTVAFTAVPGDNPDWDAGLVAKVNTQTHCSSHPLSRTNWSEDLIVNQFDPALGTLQNVDITTTCTLEQNAGVESTDTAATQIGYDTTADITLTKPDGSTQACDMNYSERFDSAAFDGVSNYAGTSGTAWIGRPFQGHSVETYTSVADFIGVGTVAFPAASNANSRMFGPGNTAFSVLTAAGASVCVTYIYEKIASSEGTLTITKVVSGDPGSITDYDVTVEGPNGYVNNATVTTGSPVVLSSLDDGVYTVTETSSGSDWLASYDIIAGTGTALADSATTTLTAEAQGTNLLTNGGFENFTGTTNNSWPDRVVTTTNLVGWTVDPAPAPAHLVFDQSVSTAPNPPVYYSAAEGEYFLNAFSKNGNGVGVQQSFNVTAGKNYCLSFNYSWGVKFAGSSWIDVPEDGYFDVRLTGALNAQQNFTGAASDVNTSADPNASEVNPVVWRHGSMIANAISSGIATLSIQALSSGSSWEAQFLDNVAIRECATPAEATVQITNDFNPAAPQVDLELTKTINTTNAKRGDSVIYTLTVTNKGPDDATGIVANDKLPTGLTYTGHIPQQSNYDPASGNWTVGNLPANQSVTLEIEATLD